MHRIANCVFDGEDNCNAASMTKLFNASKPHQSPIKTAQISINC